VSALDYRAGALDRRYFGVVVGLVTDNQDPSGLGRVKLTFPWYDDQSETDWCRVVYPYAGPGYGAQWVPEKKTEVLVGFDMGDMKVPYVLGGLFNGVDNPVNGRKADEEQDEKIFRTKGGHQLLLRDTLQKTEVELTTSGGHHLALRDRQKDGGSPAISLKTTGGHQLELDDDAGTVSLTTSGGQSVKLEAGKVTVTATQVTLSAAKVELGTGAAQSVILGEAFQTLFNAHVHTSPPTGGPTSPPVTPMLPMMLSQVTKTG
jgi:uncharacterized protein involved in type VI secretion and phage assembly